MPEQPSTRKAELVDPELYSQYQDCDRWAVIVGVSKYQYPNLTLRYADRDAEELYKLLLTSNGGGFQSDHICKLTNEQATTSNITRALRSFLKKPAREDLVLIYFACHGSPDPDRPDNVYLLTYDTDPNDIAGTALPMEDIDRALKGILHSEKVIILADTCHSAAIGGGIGGRRSVVDDSKLMNRYLQDMSRSKGGVALLTSAEANEVSFEDMKWGGGHGVFTHYLLEGMRGAADRDGNGMVTIGELFEYVRDNVKKATEYRQHPSIGTNSYDRNMPVAIATQTIFAQSSGKHQQRAQNIQEPLRSVVSQTVQESLDITLEIALSTEEMLTGIDKLISTDHQKITVKIPAGVSIGKRIRVRGQGKINPENHQRGDLFLQVVQEYQSPYQYQQQSFDNLRSEKGIDYTNLQDLLKTGKWGKADGETIRLLLKIVSRTQIGWLRRIDFDSFPCADLRTINQLWEGYSYKNFGFSVQKQIWESMRYSTQRENIIRNFCRTCGSSQIRKGIIGRWNGDKTLSIEEVYERANCIVISEASTEELDNIPRGLLPAIAHWHWLEKGQGIECLDAFFGRLDTCDM